MSDFTRIELLVIRELDDRHTDANIRAHEVNIRKVPGDPIVALIEETIHAQKKFRKQMNEKIEAHLLAIHGVEGAVESEDEQDADQSPTFSP